jgi:DNA polymerase III epsilon subunit-like protein
VNRPLRFFDTETTGLSDTDQVVEFGWVRITAPEPETDTYGSLLVHPCPISPEASAIHGLTEADIADEPPGSHYADHVKALLRDNICVAHNLMFDLRMVDQTWAHSLGSGEVICTMRCARQLWPLAQSRRLQDLRQMLVLPDHPAAPNALPHRALKDALTAAMLLRRMLGWRSAERFG